MPQYNSTAPTAVAGQWVEQQTDSRGNTKVAIVAMDGISGAIVGPAGDSSSNGLLTLYTTARQAALHDATGWDSWRNNGNLTLLASAARTTTVSSSDQTNYNGRGVHVVVDVTSAGTGSITATIEAKDVLSGKYYTLLAGAAVTTNSTNVYKVYPGITATANVSASDILTRTWRVTITHNNANSITYSCGASVIL